MTNYHPDTTPVDGTVAPAAPTRTARPQPHHGAEREELLSELLRGMARRVAEQRQINRYLLSVLADTRQAEERARHARHGRWRRWRIARRGASLAYRLGMISGYSLVWNGACRGCLASIGLTGHRLYLLGQSLDWWSCLLVGRHRRREIGESGLCAVCAPCPRCGSTDPTHDAWLCLSAPTTAASPAANGPDRTMVARPAGPEAA